MDSRGFTLTETILIIGLTALIFSGMLSVFILEQRALDIRSVRGDDVRQTESALRRIEKNIRQGKAVLESVTLFGTTYETGLHTLAIEIPAIDSSGATIADQTDYLVYMLSGSSVLEVSDPDVDSIRPSGIFTLAKDVEIFTVQTNGDPVENSTQVMVYLAFPPATSEGTAVQGQVRATLRNI